MHCGRYGMTSNHFGDLFKGKRVLITGHTGFKGSWLSLFLSELGAEVHGYALEPHTSPSLFDKAGIVLCLASHTIADVRNHDALTRTIQQVRPEIIFHLAAQSLVRSSYSNPRETYDVNIMGTINLMEAIRKIDSVRVCMIITSDKCYEDKEWIYPYRENDPMGGFDPYSSSKGCVELVVSAYRRSFFNPEEINLHGVSLSSVRAGNVIGGGDWSDDRILPDCIKALEKGEPIIVRNPDAVRPWQHVLEPLSGYLRLSARQLGDPSKYACAWNFGPNMDQNVTVGDVVDKVIEYWGNGTWTLGAGAGSRSKTALHEAKSLRLDSSKATTLLGWRPVYPFCESIKKTVLWYREAYDDQDFDAHAYTCSQIGSYTEAAYLSRTKTRSKREQED